MYDFWLCYFPIKIMFNLHQRNTPLRFKLINYSIFVLVSYNIGHIPRTSSTKTCKLLKTNVRTGFTNVLNRHPSTKKVFPAWNCKTLLGKLYIFSLGVFRAWRCALWIILFRFVCIASFWQCSNYRNGWDLSIIYQNDSWVRSSWNAPGRNTWYCEDSQYFSKNYFFQYY